MGSCFGVIQLLVPPLPPPYFFGKVLRAFGLHQFVEVLPAGEQSGDEGFGFGAAFFERGQLAVGGVFDDIFGDVGEVDGSGAEEVLAGDLEAVEDEAGAFGVDGVFGEAAKDLDDGELDGGGVVEAIEAGEVEAGFGLAAALVGEDGGAVDLMVVAEVQGAEGGGAAAATVGEDVAAEETLVLLRRVDFDGLGGG